MANWQAREQKLNRRRDVKEQKKFYSEPKSNKNKTHKSVMKEKFRQRERGEESEVEE